MNGHFRQALNGGIGCGCQVGGPDNGYSQSTVGAAESAPLSQCGCADSDERKRAVWSDLLLLASVLTTIYALTKKGGS